jgi:predicted metal-dependent HD superfamily phosphohydrolase
MTGANLPERWMRLMGGAPEATTAGRDLLDRYAEPHRRYHDTKHLAEVLDRIEELAAELTGAPTGITAADTAGEAAGQTADLDAVRLAGWFHDAVYDPTEKDNEERSAALAERVLPALGVPTERVAEVARLVRLTATHHPAPTDRNGAVLCDADLGILAAPPERYAAYAAAVREEYHHLDDATFRAGRAAILRQLLGRATLFRTESARADYEARARHNLGTELSLLTTAGPQGPR